MDRLLTDEEIQGTVRGKSALLDTDEGRLPTLKEQFAWVAEEQDKETARLIIERIDDIIRQSIKECEEFRGDKLEFFFVNQLIALKKELNI